MRKYYVGQDVGRNNGEEENEEGTFKMTLNAIQRYVLDGGLSADFEDRRDHVIVKVMAYTGTNEYLSRGPGTLSWLTRKAYKREARGVVTKFYIKYDIQS
jgi:hypothetical protein